MNSDQAFAELVDMGFDVLDITEAIKAVGPSLDNAVEFILSSSHRNDASASTSSICATDKKVTRKRAAASFQPSAKLRQPNIMEHLKLASVPKKSKTGGLFNASVSDTNFLAHVDEPGVTTSLHQEIGMAPSSCNSEEMIGFDWEKKANDLLQKSFGYSSLKAFQKEALAAWSVNQDSLVLAATGSGTSLLHSSGSY